MWVGYEDALNARRDATMAAAELRIALTPSYGIVGENAFDRFVAAKHLLERAISLIDEALDEHQDGA